MVTRVARGSRQASASDAALVTRIAAGDYSALASLYDRYGRVAYGLAVTLLPDQSLAEDVVQRAFLEVWHKPARVAPTGGSIGNWIVQLVHRRAVELIRHERQRPSAEAMGDRKITVPAPVQGERPRLERMRVLGALARLPAPEREVIELAYYLGLTQSQIAERLERPVQTITRLMSAGLVSLHRLLE